MILRTNKKSAVATTACFLVWLGTVAGGMSAEPPPLPLKPADRSSPRAALRTFLETGDKLGAFLAQDYLRAPSRAGFHQVVALSDEVLRSLDLTQLPPATRNKAGRAAALALYSTLNRIPLPALDAGPENGWTSSPGGTNAPRWVIPDTEIAVELAVTGPRRGEFLFSPDTVARAAEFYQRVRHLPYLRPVPLENTVEIVTLGGAG